MPIGATVAEISVTGYSKKQQPIYTPCPRKKGATDFFDFFAVTFTNIDGFS